MVGLLLLVLVLTSACASTGAVPRPFPGARVPPVSRAPAEETPRAPTDEPALAPLEGTARGSLLATALSLRGTPYRNGGSDPNGFDCSGFTQYVFAHHGVALARDVRDQFAQGRPVDSRELSPGDLVFFRTTGADVSHVAIVVGGDEFVHAPSSSGVVRVEHLNAPYWFQRFVGARRIEELRIKN